MNRTIKKDQKINLLVTTDHGGYKGNLAGVGSIISYTLPHLDPNRFKIVLVILRDDGSLKARLQGTGIKIIQLHRRKFDPRTLYDLFKIIKKENIHLIHAYQYTCSNFCRIAGRATGVPVILQADDLNYNYPWYQWVADRFLKNLTDYVMAVSESAKASYVAVRGIDPKKITVIHNAVPADAFKRLDPGKCNALKSKLGLPLESRIVGTVTRLHTVKGNEVFLKAAAIVLKRLPYTHFIIVGDGPLKQELIETARELNIDDHVFFIGFQKNVADFLSLFDVKVVASNTEGFPLALIEAMILGKPVVATAVGGNREIITQDINGLLVPSQSPEPMAEKIIYLLEHPKERERLGAAAEQDSKKYALEQHIRLREQMYEEAVDKVFERQ